MWALNLSDTSAPVAGQDLRPARVSITQGTTLTFGRTAPSDVILPSVHISRQHATITVDGAGLAFLRDTSSNGCTIRRNGAPPICLKNDGQALQEGDEILFGLGHASKSTDGIEYKYVLRSEEAEPPPAAILTLPTPAASTPAAKPSAATRQDPASATPAHATTEVAAPSSVSGGPHSAVSSSPRSFTTPVTEHVADPHLAMSALPSATQAGSQASQHASQGHGQGQGDSQPASQRLFPEQDLAGTDAGVNGLHDEAEGAAVGGGAGEAMHVEEVGQERRTTSQPASWVADDGGGPAAAPDVAMGLAAPADAPCDMMEVDDTGRGTDSVAHAMEGANELPVSVAIACEQASAVEEEPPMQTAILCPQDAAREIGYEDVARSFIRSSDGTRVALQFTPEEEPPPGSTVLEYASLRAFHTTDGRGWGLNCVEPIMAGTFVVEMCAHATWARRMPILPQPLASTDQPCLICAKLRPMRRAAAYVPPRQVWPRRNGGGVRVARLRLHVRSLTARPLCSFPLRCHGSIPIWTNICSRGWLCCRLLSHTVARLQVRTQL